MTSAKPAQPTRFNLLAVQPGDVIFVLGNPRDLAGKLRQTINIHGQRVLASMREDGQIDLQEKLPHYSHVMLGLGNGCIIHADGTSVAVEVFHDALHFDRGDAYSFKVYRKRGLKDSALSAVTQHAQAYFGQRYSFLTHLREQQPEDTTQFCSRLVAHAYREAGAPLNDQQDNKALPVDLYLACQGEDWEDVSASFIEDELAAPIQALFDDIDQAVLGSARLLGALHTLQHNHHEQAQAIEENLLAASQSYHEQALLVRRHPDQMNDMVADGICTVLGALDTLLEAARLPTLDTLVPPLVQDSARLPYVGIPMPAALQATRLERASLGVHTDYVRAEIGMYAILGRIVVDDERFAPFRAIDARHVDRFEAALQSPAAHQVLPAQPFAWAADARLRGDLQRISQFLLAACAGLALHRAQQQSAE
ncbi:permuted papain-like amidase YaeF/Yiix C92 family enzyme [Pseudoduganella lurida]|uniref:Permuted papain-like amidase YaeF/Yiix C92 family enzyme n=1 Tax=Pseudoduganella lurida TaxID=1036180 RepID=A0A562R5Z9_9BURK|nr:hypothetical protein [Pseudoduganella lurida]TWI64491.1 permuted papain-like amidase YaeF/Yiix C92 family enzyme [Pseudoduganella lurida]